MIYKFFLILLFLVPFNLRAQDFANSYDNQLRVQTHRVAAGENLHEIAMAYDLGFDELVRANPEIENGNIIYIDQRLVLPMIHLIPDAKLDGIIINLAEMRLYFVENNRVKSFPISIGGDEKTPTGITKIIGKKKDPSWRPPLAIRAKKPNLPEVMPPGPDNPMGKYALYFDWKNDNKWQGIAIHGTDNPSSIGSRVSLGCMRLYPQNIEELFSVVTIGTKINIISQEIKVSEINDKVFVEMHIEKAPDLILDGAKAKEIICKKIKNCETKINWDKLDEVLIRNLGIPEEISTSTLLNN